MSLPTISAFCATYGRHPSFLGEVIESFARQDYEGESELVIFSDDESQDLSYNGPLNVKVVNHRPRITPLARVFNAAIDRCEGQLIMPWESDDIFLPHRMSLTVDKIEGEFFHSHNAWFYDQGHDKLEAFGNHCLCNLAASRELWDAVGCFSVEDRPGVDVDLLTAMREASGQTSQELTQREAFYIYRWNNGSYHASGWGDKAGMAARVAREAKRSRIPRGKIELVSEWRQDYCALTEGWLAEHE
jgi:glycosyltransferase involved in cell wall biosynthesis